MQDDGPGEYQPIPLDKIEDFGVHCKQYLGIVHSVRSPVDLAPIIWKDEKKGELLVS